MKNLRRGSPLKHSTATMTPQGVMLEESAFTNNHERLEDLAARHHMHDMVVMDPREVPEQTYTTNSTSAP
ncbi:MAG TPA: hypothetical protein VED24_02620 [Candidatus Acidoferrum sp.]|nr:hypothetical protein [Candidatus Acidoferrum sp.]